MKRAALLLATLLIAAFALAACGESDTESSDDAGARGDDYGSTETATIVITGFEFEVPDSVGAGTTVTVRNEDDVEHSVTARDDTFDVEVEAGETVTFTAPADARTYDIYCTYHPDMTGQLTVS
ncbi:cupredoxin domain-containing protein [Rhodococcus artemisiae]|uniref:Cupredoxin domain-containing protein n=1 Tax=Rhodococcus artemisiae TaxID=714159 RepID=A0ABU7L573_9NOCA|nr:cupredoxin domain-containing protein [Rhodococcus artemisiae]MEE2056696.1 cupredoxin domain-containing protein [Rhodococcus artemisiae]